MKYLAIIVPFFLLGIFAAAACGDDTAVAEEGYITVHPMLQWGVVCFAHHENGTSDSLSCVKQ